MTRRPRNALSIDREPLRISQYRPSPAIDALIHPPDAGANELRQEVVRSLRTATTDALNSYIERTGADRIRYAGLVEGLV
jgi:hypothetical protein